jgi:hypothetical protein
VGDDTDYEDVTFDRDEDYKNATSGWNADGRPSTLELLEQKKWWYPADGRKLKVKQLAPGHRANLIAWFERRAGYLQTQEAMLCVAARDTELGGRGRSWSPDEMLREHFATSALYWLRAKPLIQRLSELEAKPKPVSNGLVVHRAPQGLYFEKVWASVDGHWVEGIVRKNLIVHAVLGVDNDTYSLQLRDNDDAVIAVEAWQR